MSASVNYHRPTLDWLHAIGSIKEVGTYGTVKFATLKNVQLVLQHC